MLVLVLTSCIIKYQASSFLLSLLPCTFNILVPVRHGSQIKRTPAPPPPPGKVPAPTPSHYGSLGRAPPAPRLWSTTTTGVL